MAAHLLECLLAAAGAILGGEGRVHENAVDDAAGVAVEEVESDDGAEADAEEVGLLDALVPHDEDEASGVVLHLHEVLREPGRDHTVGLRQLEDVLVHCLWPNASSMQEDHSVGVARGRRDVVVHPGGAAQLLARHVEEELLQLSLPLQDLRAQHLRFVSSQIAHLQTCFH